MVKKNLDSIGPRFESTYLVLPYGHEGGTLGTICLHSKPSIEINTNHDEVKKNTTIDLH